MSRKMPLAFAFFMAPALAAAQAAAPSPTPTPAPAAAAAPTPDDTPTVRVGATIYTDFTYVAAPQIKDADGNTVHSSAFDVGRAYINAAGNLSHLLSYRVTADIRRFTSGSTTSTPSIEGSDTFRLKYAYGQLSLESFLPKGSWVRLGAHQTPFVDYEEGIYGYRFQGTVFVEREGYLSSSDFGISTRVTLPTDHGEIHAGVYNGETYAKGEVNNQKAFQIRGTLRPSPKSAVLKGLRLTAFYDADHYVQSADRTRLILNATFEHKHIVLGGDWIKAADQASSKSPRVESNGYSVWARPRASNGLEALLRYDSLKPNDSISARKKRTLLGGAYWFKTKAPVTAAVLLDYEHVTYGVALARPTENRIALHSLFAF
jgi:hypothetical protein